MRVLTDREEVEVSQELQRVIQHRYEWLLSAGWTRRNAQLVASDMEIDWHFAYNLRKQCEDEALCMRIIYGS